VCADERSHGYGECERGDSAAYRAEPQHYAGRRSRIDLCSRVIDEVTTTWESSQESAAVARS
jgi:hypothetical protein